MDLDYHQVHNALASLTPQGAVFELRLLGTRKGQVDSGYFNDPAQAATALVAAQGYYQGMYFTPNPVLPDAMARSYNRIQPWAPHQTHDPEIVRRRWLLVDVDPRRPSGVSSSDAEHEAALNKAAQIAGMLSLTHGFCDPVLNDSGNGAHLMYPMDEENSDEVRDEIQRFLRTLRAMYADQVCDIDTTVFNAARIWRVPGTWARKGDSTPERPHRRSRIVKYPQNGNRLTFSQILRFNEAHKDALNEAPLSTPGTKRFEYPADEVLYRRLNEFALRNLGLWVPHFFPAARQYKEGYRVSSQDLGLQYEEDLTIHPPPVGIKYFGIADQGDAAEGRRTPVGTIAEFSLHTKDKGAAARELSKRVNFPITELDRLPPPQGYGNGGGIGVGMDALLGPKPKFDFKGIRSVADLKQQKFTEVKWVIKNVLPYGNMLLAARPKMRKTWLALQLGKAVATGGKFLDYQCEQSDVLMLLLEDNERRMRNRMDILDRFEIRVPDLSGFRYWTGGMDYDLNGRLKVMNPEEHQRTLDAFPKGEAGVDALEQFVEQFPKTKLIIIDTLQHFRGERTSRDIYASDYEAMMPITKLAARKELMIMPVMHEKKGNADRGIGADFLEDVSGSAGITGGADGVISIKGRRGVQTESESRKLLISGRDVPFDYEIDITFDAETGGWRKAAREDIKVSIRALLTRHPFLNQRDLMNLLPDAGQARIYRCLTDMKMEGEIEQGKYGYSLKRDN